MDLKSKLGSPILTDPIPISKPRLGIHDSLLPYSLSGVYPQGPFLTIPWKKPGLLDDVLSTSWLDAMKSSSPRNIIKYNGYGFSSNDVDVAYNNWMLNYPSALTSFEQIVNNAKGKRIALFLDYDGTLSPIVDNPDHAFMSSAMRAAVRNVAKYIPTAIISGRSREKVRKFVGLKELYYAGSHGMDIMGPFQPQADHATKVKEGNLYQPASEYLSMVNEVFVSLVEITKNIEGAKVENNKFCVSVHYRNVDEKSWITVAEYVQDILKRYPRLRLTHGRMVLEIRPVLKWDKGKAVEFLLESLGLSSCEDVLPIYVGDDRTDEDAFKFLRESNRGYGILVTPAPKESNAYYSLRDPSEVIAVNGKFPGPTLNVTTNYNVIVNVKNRLDESLLITWPGIEMRRSSWQDGVLGTNCPIPAKWNWTYRFQVKDQIGSYHYVPSTNFQRAAGGFGGFIITNRKVIQLPFNTPDGDMVITIGDWYTRNHSVLRESLDAGKKLGMPNGVLINGKGPFKYSSIVPDGINHTTVGVDPGKTYRIRVINIGVSTCLNFRIQSHNLLLAEAEGHYTSQQNYSSFDIHVGQSYSFLVTMDQNASTDYYIVASPRFVNQSDWQRVTGVAILHYSNSKGDASGPLPDPPNDIYDHSFALNQALSIRMNNSASGARPNPQGSFHYGSINVTDTYVLRSIPPVMINGKRRASFNGISFANPKITPVRLADNHNVKGAYKLDFPKTPVNETSRVDRSIINATYKGFAEIILQNNDTVVQSFHMDGYSFFVVGMAYGNWTENSRGSYNRWDAISRSTTQVFPGGWTAILVYLDNVGAWNLRTVNLDRWYLGQETYIRIINPEDHNQKTELPVPDNALFCGVLGNLQRPQRTILSSAGSTIKELSKSNYLMLMAFAAVVYMVI